MDAVALIALMGCSDANAQKYLAGTVEAMQRAEISNPLRVAHFVSQIGHECNGFIWMQELASGRDYEGRADLGNTEAGDGVRFKGHGAIQVTGKKNHLRFGQWMGEGDLFVRDPQQIVTNPRYAMLTAAWYWIEHKLNSVVDSDDGSTSQVSVLDEKKQPKLITVNTALKRITRIVNGATNGIEDRQKRFERARKALSPS